MSQNTITENKTPELKIINPRKNLGLFFLVNFFFKIFLIFFFFFFFFFKKNF